MKNYKVIQQPSIRIMGIECRTSNAPETGPHDIPKLWQRFYSEDTLSKIPNKISNEIIALYCDYEGDHTQPYSVVIGCQVSSSDVIPEGMVARTIPASSYAVFRAIGEHPKALIETWGKIWQESGLERSYTGDYEVYNEKFFSKSPQEIDIYVAVEELEFEATENSNSADLDFLTQKINEELAAYPFAIFVRNKEGKIVGGCNGSIICGSIYTDQLWVDPHLRNRGLGKKLMEAVHEYGKNHGCMLATVTTMDFQAPYFYAKIGYKIDFSKEGYSKGASCIFMSKQL